jgi:hypothetical protein
MTRRFAVNLLLGLALTTQCVSAAALNTPGHAGSAGILPAAWLATNVAADRMSALPAAARPFGLRLDMTEEEAHERLRKIATQEKEEKEKEEGGEQEVWILKRDAKYSYLIARFSRDHRLILITVVARPQRARYSDVGRLKDAAKATDGQNYSYKWKVERRKDARSYILTARGSHPEFLTSYSIYFTAQD